MMEFLVSSESHRPAGMALDSVRRCVVPFLKAAFAASSLATLKCTLRYVPIVMPESMHARYPTRSKLRKKELLYDCAPILDYEAFIGRDFESQLREYLRGIALSGPHLTALGASPQQVEEFNAILASAVGRIMLEWTDQARCTDTAHGRGLRSFD
jgi:hypothetical protein